jgi:hypothetical protein
MTISPVSHLNTCLSLEAPDAVHPLENSGDDLLHQSLAVMRQSGLEEEANQLFTHINQLPADHEIEDEFDF